MGSRGKGCDSNHPHNFHHHLGGLFKQKDMFTSMFGHCTIVVGDGKFIWNHQGAHIIFKDSGHHWVGRFNLGIWYMM